MRNKILSIEREDGVTFNIGDTIKINNKKATFHHIISGFMIDGDVCCIKTMEPNDFGDGCINIDILEKLEDTGMLTRKCLSIADYLNVLIEKEKAFLFKEKMTEILLKIVKKRNEIRYN